MLQLQRTLDVTSILVWDDKELREVSEAEEGGRRGRRKEGEEEGGAAE